jgi:hypothetical protein
MRMSRIGATGSDEFTRGKQPIAQAHFGHDDDAHLKNRLAGGYLSSSLLDAAIYR